VSEAALFVSPLPSAACSKSVPEASAVTVMASSPAPAAPSGRVKAYSRASEPPASRTRLARSSTSTSVAEVVVFTTRTRSCQPAAVAADPALTSFQRIVTRPPDWSAPSTTVRPVTPRSG